MMMGELYTEVSVVFENVRFQRATNIPKDGNLEFIIMIQKGSGNFEVRILTTLGGGWICRFHGWCPHP